MWSVKKQPAEGKSINKTKTQNETEAQRRLRLMSSVIGLVAAIEPQLDCPF